MSKRLNTKVTCDKIKVKAKTKNIIINEKFKKYKLLPR